MIRSSNDLFANEKEMSFTSRREGQPLLPEYHKTTTYRLTAIDYFEGNLSESFSRGTPSIDLTSGDR